MKDASKFKVYWLPANFELEGMKTRKHGLTAKNNSKMAAFKVDTNFFRVAGT